MRELWKELWKYSYTNMTSVQQHVCCMWIRQDCCGYNHTQSVCMHLMCVCTMRCIYPCMHAIVWRIIYRHAHCSHSCTWRMCTAQCCIGHCTHNTAGCYQCVVMFPCYKRATHRIHVWHSYVYVWDATCKYSTRLETRTKESNVCASSRLRQLTAQ